MVPRSSSDPAPAFQTVLEKRRTLWTTPSRFGEMSVVSKRRSRGGSVLRLGYRIVAADAADGTDKRKMSAATTSGRAAEIPLRTAILSGVKWAPDFSGQTLRPT